MRYKSEPVQKDWLHNMHLPCTKARTSCLPKNNGKDKVNLGRPSADVIVAAMLKSKIWPPVAIKTRRKGRRWCTNRRAGWAQHDTTDPESTGQSANDNEPMDRCQPLHTQATHSDLASEWELNLWPWHRRKRIWVFNYSSMLLSNNPTKVRYFKPCH